MRLRQRRAPLLATLAAVALGAALVAACGGLFETALRLDAPPQRFAGADVVVAASEHAQVNEHAVALTERARLPRGLADELRSVPGVTRVQADPFALAVRTSDPDAVRAALDGRPVEVLTGDDRGRGEVIGVAAARLKLILIASIFGGLALIVMAILVASIISLAVRAAPSRVRAAADDRRDAAAGPQARGRADRAPGAGRGGGGRASSAPCWRASCSRAFRTAASSRACSPCAKG